MENVEKSELSITQLLLIYNISLQVYVFEDDKS